MTRAARSGARRRPAFGKVLGPLGREYPHELFLEAHGPDPFRILIGCVLSLRTKDEVAFPATERLFAQARTPRTLGALPASRIERLIYPAGFYRRKAEQIRKICAELTSRYGGRVPDEIDELLTLPGVGRKTANLVVTLGFRKPGICVDTHVHRISNRLGWVRTKNPEETEWALRATLPRRYWITVNEILVRHGQRVCKPLSPICSDCTVRAHCLREGVSRSR